MEEERAGKNYPRISACPPTFVLPPVNMRAAQTWLIGTYCTSYRLRIRTRYYSLLAKRGPVASTNCRGGQPRPVVAVWRSRDISTQRASLLQETLSAAEHGLGRGHRCSQLVTQVQDPQGFVSSAPERARRRKSNQDKHAHPPSSHQPLPKRRPSTSLPPWLFPITKRQLPEFFRSANKRPVLCADTIPSPVRINIEQEQGGRWSGSSALSQPSVSPLSSAPCVCRRIWHSLCAAPEISDRRTNQG